MSIDIDHLSIDELVALNDRVVERIQLLDDMQAHHDMMECHRDFNIGNTVRFNSKHGPQIGKLVKFNRKTVDIITGEGRRWRVPPNLISAVKEVGGAQPTAVTAKKRPE